MTKFTAALVAVVLLVVTVVVLLDPWRPDPSTTEATPSGAAGDPMVGLAGLDVTAERVREVCEREIRLRSDLPFTEFPRPGAPEYSEPIWVLDLEAWVWVVELVHEEGMALRREWECRITGDGRGLLRRNY